MNCKEGDLAVIVKSLAGNEGKIVRCVKFVGKVRGIKQADLWKIDSLLNGDGGGKFNFSSDRFMRPIRDSDKQDEMLSIVSLKEKVKS